MVYEHLCLTGQLPMCLCRAFGFGVETKTVNGSLILFFPTISSITVFVFPDLARIGITADYGIATEVAKRVFSIR
ncbi:MAG: hypothetical protein JW883_00275 [Deltaproteobacteria bacterium]|nr:hypothetical protein [Deltaproteobacteria bacterium]